VAIAPGVSNASQLLLAAKSQSFYEVRSMVYSLVLSNMSMGDDHGRWIDGPNPTPIMVARIGLFVGGDLLTLRAALQIARSILLKVARAASRKPLGGFQKGLIF
jgi:hypothetical protein